MQPVGSRLDRYVDDAALIVPHLCRCSVCDEVDGFYRIQRRLERDDVLGRLVGVDAVELKVVGLPSVPVHREAAATRGPPATGQPGRTGDDDAWGEQRERHEIVAIGRQAHDVAAVERGAHLRRVDLQAPGVRPDVDDFRSRSDLERYVESHRFGRSDWQRVGDKGLEPVASHGEPIAARWERRERIHAGFAGRDAPGATRAELEAFDVGPGYRRVRRVANRSAEAGCRNLSANGRPAKEERDRDHRRAPGQRATW